MMKQTVEYLLKHDLAEKVKQANEYRSYALNKAKDVISERKVKSLLRRFATQNKFKVANNLK